MLATGESECAGQTSQMPVPTALLNFPLSHAVQLPFAATVLYFPATHASHGPPSGPEKPALQVQFAKDELLKGEAEFPGHNKHAEASVDEYV